MCVGRAPSPAAFEVGVGFFGSGCPARLRGVYESRTTGKVQVKSGGPECPPHTVKSCLDEFLS